MGYPQQVKALFQRHTGVRYLFVGATSYVFELSTLLLIHHLTGSRALATAISFWVGFFMAFTLQKLVAFQEYSKEVRALTKQGVLYGLLNFWNYVFTIAFVAVFPDKYLIASRTVALVLMSSWNYVMYRKVIFKTSVKNPI
jgi:putative flippase GtrA